MAQKTFFAVKDLDGDGKHYCAVSFESKLAREAFCELNGYEPVLVKWALDNLAGSVYNDIRHYPNTRVKLMCFTTYIFDLACEWGRAVMHLPFFLEINQRPQGADHRCRQAPQE